MAATSSPPPRALIVMLAASLVLVVVADGATAWVRGTKAKPVTVSQAVKRYRASAGQTPTATAAATPTASASSTPSAHPPATRTATPTPSPTATTAATATATPTHRTTTTHPTASSSSTSPPPLALTPSGVYRYATTGGEQVNLPAGKRSFPATTTVTVQPQGCGIASTWLPLTEHSETQILCLHDNAVELSSYQTKISFYGISNTEDFSCPANSLIYSPALRPGQTWSFTCKSAHSKLAQDYTAVGFQTLTVAGKPVRTLHIHVDATLSGSDSGTSPQDFWISTKSFLVIRNTGDVDATQSGLHYKENFVLNLDSLTPQR